ncbi:MAG TPA: DUF3800 domain-containing protein [Bacillus sp. (in: firmicutes)]|nr:DUF3800 domain-containing protein [Bacillus sp. (in: firmicutes)]
MKHGGILVFIDDSGDPGLGSESSPVFVIALVIFDDTLVAEETALAIKKLRRKLHFPDDVEFKFHKSRLPIKRRFLETVVHYPFRIRAIVVEKDKIRPKFNGTDKETFFNHIVLTVLQQTKGTVRHAKLRFDKRGERRIRNELRAYLSQALDNKVKNIFTDLKFVDSKRDNLVQLADMVAGAIAAYYKGHNTGLFSLIKKRVEDIEEYR